NHDLTKEILELILNIKISKLTAVVSQRSLKFTPFDHGVRLDVFVEDTNQVRYDIEMQTTDEPEIGKRSRYYHSMIDLDSIESGTKYSDLKKSYVIFICKNTPSAFKVNLPVYTFHSKCDEDEKVDLKDEQTTVVLNASGPREGLRPELDHFLDYLSENVVADPLSTRLEAEVESARSSAIWRTEYMTFKMKLDEAYESGVEEGVEKGIARIITYMYSQGKTVDEIVKDTGCAYEDVMRITQEGNTSEE
ncbi:MAG: Rpn family recombination-promoting nuclease/putative transposase, partial [Lachnospiraceae bacterium]|nr:Rpn family recombination-promoting nuclease/putative transposase [Lachnospiraceae bacterium]